jgi:predicted nucleic acid-binding protein
VILPDVNVLVYAHRRDTEQHRPLRRWLEDVVAADQAYALSDLVLSGFIRVVTHPRIFREPSPLGDALAFAGQLLGQAPGTGTSLSGCVRRLRPAAT